MFVSSFRLLILFAAINHWPLYQFDIKNVFLHSILDEEIYMKQRHDFIA